MKENLNAINNQFPELYETSAVKELNLGIMLVFWAFLSMITENEFKEPIENPGPELSGLPRKRRGNRLFYMVNTPEGFRTVDKAQSAVLKAEMPDSLYAIWASNANEARQKLIKGEGEKYSEQLRQNFSGHLLNCIGWQQVTTKKGQNVSRCFIYAPNCKTKACIKDTEERKAEGWTPRQSPKASLDQAIEKAKRTVKDKDLYILPTYEGSYRVTSKPVSSTAVSKFHVVKPDQSVYLIERPEYSQPATKTRLSGFYKSCKSFFYNAKGHLKCGEYALTCNQETECAPKPIPNPYNPQEIEISDREIKSVAKMLADEANHAIDDSKRIMRIVKEYGGIAPYKSGYLSEEYRDIPTKYKLKEGLPIDELSQEIGMNESDLVEAINKAEEARNRLPKGKRRFNIKDMMFDAEQYIALQESGGGFTGIGAYKHISKPADIPDNVWNDLQDIRDTRKSNKDRIKAFLQYWYATTNQQGMSELDFFPDIIFKDMLAYTALMEFADESDLVDNKNGKFYVSPFILEKNYYKFPEIKRELTPIQETQLLNQHVNKMFINERNMRETLRVLLDKGYLKDVKGNPVVTDKGKAYLEAYHKEISLRPERRETKPQEKRRTEPEQLKFFGKFKKLAPKERIEHIKANVSRRALRKFSHLVETAARKLREEDINRGIGVENAWNEYNKFYLPELRQYVLDLLVEGKAHVNIPAMAVSRYKSTNPITHVKETPTIIEMAMNDPQLLNPYLKEPERRPSRPEPIETKQERLKEEIVKRLEPFSPEEQKEIAKQLTQSRGGLIPKRGERITREPEQLKLFGKLDVQELDFFTRLREDMIKQIERLYGVKPRNANRINLSPYWNSPTISDVYNEINPKQLGDYLYFLNYHNPALATEYKEYFRFYDFEPEKMRNEKSINMRIPAGIRKALKHEIPEQLRFLGRGV